MRNTAWLEGGGTGQGTWSSFRRHIMEDLKPKVQCRLYPVAQPLSNLGGKGIQLGAC